MVTPEIMAVVWKTVPEYVMEVFNPYMGEGWVPDEWKVPRLVILLKGMDKDRSIQRSYRRICLLSVMGKLFERVLVGRLARVLERRWSRPQFGFMKGLGIQDPWIIVKQFLLILKERLIM